MDQIQTRLEAARQELFDLGLRNPLVNYRPLKARGLEIIKEQPAELVPLLVAEAEPFTFLPHPDEPNSQPLATSHQLQTPYAPAELQKRLLNSYFTAVSAIEEQGINLLYITLGMLHWRETPTAPDRRAPLILIPVALHREDANAPFQLQYSGEDISDNPSLRLKLTADFRLTLPSLPTADVPDVAAYFQQVAQVIAEIPEWWVEADGASATAVTLGFFSFSKLLMVEDLNPTNWPAHRQPTDHPVLQALLHPTGFRESSPIGDDAFLDDHLPLAQSHQVVDADSSQMQAILDVNNGRNLVIQGPPGTGKSQTITNLIAEALGQGKTVLFVAEKLAALEVVKRRLDEVGLGDAALELHSHKATKRAFLDELARTLKQGQPKGDGRFPAVETLIRLRTDLNEYSRALNEPIGRSGVTLYQAYGRALQLQAQLGDVPAFSQPAMRTWPQATYQAQLAQVQALQRCLRPLGVPAQHPFWGSRCQASLDTAEIRQRSQTALAPLDQLQKALQELAQHLGTISPPSRHHQEKLLFDTRQLLLAPPLYAVNVHAAAWLEQAEPLLAALEAGQRASRARAEYDQWLIPEAWGQEVMPIRQGLMAGPKWWRSLSGRYRRARQQLAGLCRRALPDSWEQQIGAIDAILAVQRARPILAQIAPLLAQLFTVRWQKEESDWAGLLRLGQWLVAAHQEIQNGRYDPALLTYLAQGVHDDWLQTAVATVEQAWLNYGTAVTPLLTWLQFDEATRLGTKQTFLAAPFASQQDILTRLHSAADRQPEMAAYIQAARPLQADGLVALVVVADTWPGAATRLTDRFNLAWFTALIEQANITQQRLKGADSQSQNEAVGRFQELDTRFLQANRVRLAQAHWQQLPRYAAGGQMGLLQAEMNKQRQHKPVRVLMQEAGRAIQRIKPLFMMSPLSIATFLPPDSVSFDLVIFDEASQVRPVDAFGAILRGKQVVVVGDSQQLPPTTFFERVVREEEIERLGDWEIAESPNLAVSPPAISQSPESILDLFCAQNAPQRLLRWHYRSRHESLIAISNRAFYDRQLVIFPSPDAARQELGLRLHVLPHTAYDRGRSRTNPEEARAVAEAVLVQAKERPSQTLGVVAFSINQSEAIRDELERLRRADPSAEPFFKAHPAEPFFVKNLENVQGNERDVIFISVGYGRATDGSVTLNFGPINQTGGERRLNVLISRARQRCEIFTNLTAADIDADRVAARGVAVLQEYLRYAQTGELPELAPDEIAQAAPFEEVVTAALQQQGYRLAHRVGDGPVRVDLAVWDDKRPGYYHIGLECDGDNYHLARSASDRDRIQGQVLARLGWRVARVWSHAWWQAPEAELGRLLAVIRRDEAAGETFGDEHSPAASPVQLERFAGLEVFDGVRPIPDYKVAAVQLSASSKSLSARYRELPAFKKQVLAQVEQMVAVESPVHFREVVRRLGDAAGYKMLPSLESLTEIMADVPARGKVNCRGDFLWAQGMVRPSIRHRANLPPVSRKFELIAPEEVAAAVILVVTDAVEIAAEDVPLRVGRLFGFRQLGEEAETAVHQLITQMVADGRLLQIQGRLVAKG